MTAKTQLTPLKLLTLCYPVIPSGGGESGKAPLVNWLQYQTSYPDENDLERWERELHPRLWGIVTGEMCGIVIIDVDNPDLKSIFDKADIQPHIQTPRGGYHYWFRHPGRPIKTVAGILPGVDVRGDGGFVNVIGKRADGEYTCLITPTPDTVYPWEKLPQPIIEAIKASDNGHKKIAPTEEIVIPAGQRNHTLTRMAGAMRHQSMNQAAIEAALIEANKTQCAEPLPDDEVLRIAKSVSWYSPKPPLANNNNYSSLINYSPEDVGGNTERHKSVTENVTRVGEFPENVTKSRAEVIEAWIRESSGWFSYDDIDREFNITSQKDKHNRRMIIKRLKDAGLIEAHPKNNKLLRYVVATVRLIDFRAAGKRAPLAIKYPLGVEVYFNTYPGNIIALAGAADAGKTAFLLNFIRLNMYDFSIFYQSSEMGKEELASRLEKFEGINLDEWNFTAEERSRDFADVIRPDCVNVIDYMELAGDFYNISEYMRQIHDKLAGGIAIIALQKKRNAELGRGGDFGLEKPRLYLTMDKGQLVIQKAKNWVDPTYNPNGLTLKFKLVAGCQFIITEDWAKKEE